jgi:hypothetical protein
VWFNNSCYVRISGSRSSFLFASCKRSWFLVRRRAGVTRSQTLQLPVPAVLGARVKRVDCAVTMSGSGTPVSSFYSDGSHDARSGGTSCMCRLKRPHEDTPHTSRRQTWGGGPGPFSLLPPLAFFFLPFFSLNDAPAATAAAGQTAYLRHPRTAARAPPRRPALPNPPPTAGPPPPPNLPLSSPTANSGEPSRTP